MNENEKSAKLQEIFDDEEFVEEIFCAEIGA